MAPAPLYPCIRFHVYIYRLAAIKVDHLMGVWCVLLVLHAKTHKRMHLQFNGDFIQTLCFQRKRLSSAVNLSPYFLEGKKLTRSSDLFGTIHYYNYSYYCLVSVSIRFSMYTYTTHHQLLQNINTILHLPAMCKRLLYLKWKFYYSYK